MPLVVVSHVKPTRPELISLLLKLIQGELEVIEQDAGAIGGVVVALAIPVLSARANELAMIGLKNLDLLGVTPPPFLLLDRMAVFLHLIP